MSRGSEPFHNYYETNNIVASLSFFYRRLILGC